MSYNFNKAPWFDDFDTKNSFHKILFNAGKAVQARELNQLQSILQNQIGSMAGNLFKEGSRISGGTVSFNTLSWVRLNTGADISWFTKDCIAIGMGDGSGNGSFVEARVIAVTEETTTDPATLFVTYTKTGVDGETTHFIHGETLKIMSSDGSVEISDSSMRPVVRCPSCPNNTDIIQSDNRILPTGNKAKQVVVEEGVWYWNGHFVETTRQELIYSKYNELVTTKIGFDVYENIVTHEDDSSLYDNALGYPNETAPGADRYQIKLVLNKRQDVPQDGERFINVATIEDSVVTQMVVETSYNKIMDVMAQRTYEESGDYTVTPFSLSYIEHKAQNNTDPDGASVNGKEDYLRACVSEGIAYVRGYRHQKIAETFYDIRKARDTLKKEDGAVFFQEQAYVELTVDTTRNSAWANSPDVGRSLFTDQEISLYDNVVQNGTNTGNVVGKMKVWDVVQQADNSNGDKVFRYYVTDVKMNSGKSFKDVKAAGHLPSNFAASVDGEFKVVNESKRNLFWALTTPLIKSMREAENPDRGSIYLNRRIKLNATLDSTGKYTWDSTSNLFNADMNTSIVCVKDGGVWKTMPISGNLSAAGNSISVDLSSANAGKEVMVVATAFTVNLIEKTKTLVQNQSVTFTKNATNNYKSNLNLGKADAIKLREVKGDNGDDLLSFFSLNNGQTPTAYRESFLENIKEVEKDKYNSITVKFDYFNHSDTNQAGFFTIDSYNATINSPDNDYTYANLPQVVGAEGTVYDVSQIIDFRPMILSGNVSTSYMPAIGTTMVHDVEFYVPRKDIVVIDRDGYIYQKLGIPAVKPDYPNQPPNTMVLFQVYIPAYTFSYKDVKITKVENKRYTMRDIGKLESRINNLEYYTTLSLAETSVHNASITDVNGLERSKNGFIVDNFVNYSVADTINKEFKSLKDEVQRALRCNTRVHNRKLVLDEANSSNFHKRGSVVYLPYTEEVIDKQNFATKSVSINECYIFNRKGRLILSPNHNTWSDTTREAKQVWDIDTGVEDIQGLSEQINKVQKDFNDFQIINRTTTRPITPIVETTTRSTTETVQDTGRATASTGVTFNRSQTRTIETTLTTSASITAQASKIDSKTTNYSFDRVTDVKIIPYMKETTIQFVATGLLPTTKMYIFFDDVDVTQYAIQNNVDNVEKGLFTNTEGAIAGTLNLPAGMFLNGTKVMKITNDKTNSGDEDMELCHATAQFYAGGLDLSKQEIDLNIITPTLSWEDQTAAQSTVTRTTSTVREFFDPVVSQVVPPQAPPNRPVTPTPTRPWRGDFDWVAWAAKDPVAQSFTLNANAHLTKIDLFFHQIDNSADDTIWVEIRKMVNGYPSNKDVLTRKDLMIKDIQVSDDASLATTVEFDTPVYVNSNEEYCFVVGGNSPLTKLWVAKLGSECVNYPEKIMDTQAAFGSRFRSQNGSTWNAEQFEDVMYRLYAAVFDDKPMKLTFKLDNEEESVEKLPDNAFECEQGTKYVRIHTANGHALIKNDKVRITTLEGTWFDVTLTSGKLVVGHTITTATGQAKIKQLQYNPTDATKVKMLLKDVKGHILVNQALTTDTFTFKQFNQPDYVITTLTDQIAPVAGGTITGGENTYDDNTAINGIPLKELNAEFTVFDVDDDNSFTIELPTSAATQTGRFSIKNASVELNHKFEMCNLSSSMMVYDGEELWTMKSLKHGAQNTVHVDDNYGYGDSFIVQRNENVFLDRPYKLASPLNEATFASNKPSVEYTLSVVRNVNDRNVSPILNLDSISATFLSNNVSWKSVNTHSKVPNASSQYKPETHPSEGSEDYKYVSRTILLKNPAYDLKIWFDVNRPLNTDYDVYIKTSSESGQALDDKPWVLLENYNKGDVHNNDTAYTEIEIFTNETLTTPLDPFTACKVKIVGRSKNTAKYPTFKALRVIALT